jgi:hypothetical protein
MDLIKKNWRKVILLSYLFIIPVISFAEVTGGAPVDTKGMLTNPIPKITSIPGLVETILTGLIKIGIPIVALFIIYSGFLFVFARGNPEKLDTAKTTLLYTLIGSAILLGSWAIAQMISATVTGLGA